MVPDRRARKSLGGFVESTVASGASISLTTESGYAKLRAESGYGHTAVAERGDRQVAEHFCHAHVLKHVRSARQHLQRYLNEFTFRFNRRFYPFKPFRPAGRRQRSL